MSRYFFHVIDGPDQLDGEGTELPDMAAVRSEALRTAGAIVGSEDADFFRDHPWQMSVVNASGATVYSLHFEAREYPLN